MVSYINTCTTIGWCACLRTYIWLLLLQLSELELLTYWTTYLYCRCNKSVSYATPAYYAHCKSRWDLDY